MLGGCEGQGPFQNREELCYRKELAVLVLMYSGRCDLVFFLFVLFLFLLLDLEGVLGDVVVLAESTIVSMNSETVLRERNLLAEKTE